ncbi:hypothetical protein ACR9E3_30385 [Actinomycetospora sp. C-140]
MLAEVLAVGSAVAAGSAVVAQQRAAHELGGADHRLLRRPWWLAGTGASVLASLLQAAALADGAVAVVQALLATAVAWAAVGEALLARRMPGPGVVLGVVLAVAGPLLVALLLGPATTGATTVDLTAGPVLAGLAGVGVVALGGLAVARRRPGPPGALGLALTCGVGYGLAASLLALVVRALVRDPGGALTDPQLVVAGALLVLVGPGAFALSQRALARARRAGPVVTTILLVDPLAATTIGAAWFGETVALDGSSAVAVVLAVALAALGVRLLDPAPRVLPAHGESTSTTPGPTR